MATTTSPMRALTHLKLSLLSTLLLQTTCLAPWASAAAVEPAMINATIPGGKTVTLAANRLPTLWTGDFGDCLGGESLFNVTKFDTAFYSDNQTIVMHLDGSTNIQNQDLMLYLWIEAYGEMRFNTTINPCTNGLESLCPVGANTPIEAWLAINVTAAQTSQIIPSIGLDIPDFEGAARLEILSNSTRTQIGCFQAVMRNGYTLSHPDVIGPILGAFTFVAVLSSFATAIYGFSITHTRLHYAHAFSVLIIFETFQSIFFSGALSVPWPSVLPSWWSNFAWSAGMMYNHNLIDSMASFSGITGNATQVGGAGSSVLSPGGGVIQRIYGRSTTAVADLHRRAHFAYNESNPYDYTWAGNPVRPGLPTSGQWPGFAGTLEPLGIPIANAFLVGLIWFLVAVVAVAVLVALAKFVLDLLIKVKLLKTEGFNYFRSHMPGFVVVSVLRTLLIAFFTIVTLALLQFNQSSPAGPTAIAAVVFVMFLIGVGGLVTYACWFRLRFGKYSIDRDVLRFEHGKVLKKIPFVVAVRASKIGERETMVIPMAQIPIYVVNYKDDNPDRVKVHNDEAYIKRFGWLTAHYRRTRWWFFSLWLAYQFTRACLLGGGVKTPLAQVFCLFVFDILALLVFWKLNPLEGQRNTAIAIWMLFVSKIATTGFSIAFLPDFGLSRSSATVIGIVIIVIQAFLAIIVIILILIGCISSWMSLSRNREQFPDMLARLRVKYYKHVSKKGEDQPRPAKKEVEKEVKEWEEPTPMTSTGHFSINSLGHTSRLDIGNGEGVSPYHAAVLTPVKNRASRANSVGSQYSITGQPTSMRGHAKRASWSTKDLAQWDAQQSERELAEAAAGNKGSVGRQRSNSLRIQALKAQGSQTQLRLSTMGMDGGVRSTTPADDLRESPTKITEEREEEARMSEEARRATMPTDVVEPKSEEAKTETTPPQTATTSPVEVSSAPAPTTVEDKKP